MSPEDVRLLLTDLEHLHRQVDVLETNVAHYRNLAIVLFSLLTLIGIERLWSMWKSIGVKVAEEAAKQATHGQELISKIESEWRQLRSTLESSYLIRSGSQSLTIANGNYVNSDVNFDPPFPSAPVVVLSEQIPGEWCYAKIDELDRQHFRIAMRTLTAVNVQNLTRNIQWIAICAKPTLVPLDPVDPAVLKANA
jgi:hypothetical protein